MENILILIQNLFEKVSRLESCAVDSFEYLSVIKYSQNKDNNLIEVSFLDFKISYGYKF